MGFETGIDLTQGEKDAMGGVPDYSGQSTFDSGVSAYGDITNASAAQLATNALAALSVADSRSVGLPVNASDLPSATQALRADLNLANDGEPSESYPNQDGLRQDLLFASTVFNEIGAGSDARAQNLSQLGTDLKNRFQLATGLSLGLVLLVGGAIVALVILSDVAILKGAKS